MIEYLTSNLWLVWSIIAVACLILELSSGDFYVTCFAIGAACAAVSTFLGIPFWAQVLVFAVGSVLSIWLIRPRLVGRLHRGGEERQSNADALVGREGVVIETIPEDATGYVKVDGDEWRARSADGESIEKGARVRVTDRQSIIVKVEKLKS